MSSVRSRRGRSGLVVSMGLVFSVVLGLLMSATPAGAADVTWYEEDFQNTSTTNDWDPTAAPPVQHTTSANDGEGGDGINADGAIYVVGAGGMSYDLGALDSQATNITVDGNVFHENFNGNFDMYLELYNADADRVVASETIGLPNGLYQTDPNTFTNVTLSYMPVFEERGDMFSVRLTTGTDSRRPALDYVKAVYSTGTIETDDSIWYEAAFTKQAVTSEWTAIGNVPVEYSRTQNDGDGGDGVSEDGVLYVAGDGGTDGGAYSLGALDAAVTNLTVFANVLHENYNSTTITVDLYNATDATIVASTSAAPPNDWYPTVASFEDVTFSYEPVAGDAGDTFQVRFRGSTASRRPALDYIRVHAYQPDPLPAGTVICIQ